MSKNGTGPILMELILTGETNITQVASQCETHCGMCFAKETDGTLRVYMEDLTLEGGGSFPKKMMFALRQKG